MEACPSQTLSHSVLEPRLDWTSSPSRLNTSSWVCQSRRGLCSERTISCSLVAIVEPTTFWGATNT